MRFLIVVLFLLGASYANATNKPEPPKQHPTDPGVVQGQGQGQGQLQAQGQLQGQSQGMAQRQSASSKSSSSAVSVSASGASSDQTQSQSANNEGNSLSVTNEAEDNIKIRNTPDPYAPAVIPTSPCLGGGSAGVTGPGFGVTAGGSKVDENCTRREEVRLVYSLGSIDGAARLYCYPDPKDDRSIRMVNAAFGDQPTCYAILTRDMGQHAADAEAARDKAIVDKTTGNVLGLMSERDRRRDEAATRK